MREEGAILVAEMHTVDTLIDEHLRGLSRALVQNRNEDVYAHHRELYLIGQAVIPYISDQLLSYSWRAVKYREQLSLLSGLLSLAHDIDEDSAHEISARIEKKGCEPSVQSIMRSILSFSLDNFVHFSICGVAVYCSKELDRDCQTIVNKLGRWLPAVTEGDLGRIDRIYVVPSCGSHARGTYKPILCAIAIGWDVPSNPLLRWFCLLRVEHTLYHEIGHHVFRHELGQDPDQEEQADDYAGNLVRRNHPLLRGSVRVVAKLVRRQPSAL